MAETRRISSPLRGASGPVQAPPAPPPLPSLPCSDTKTSKFPLKVQAAPPGWCLNARTSGQAPDPAAAPTGPYFFYGTLMDPNMLKDVLGLHELPWLRPATIHGYRCRSWGQYPALVDGGAGEVVTGRVWNVASTAHAARLAEYETRSYDVVPVRIQYADSESPKEDSGRVFVFTGRDSELNDTKFDLDLWLQRMGRASRT